MKNSKAGDIVMFISIILLLISPAYAVSSTSTQTVSVTVPEINAVSITYVNGENTAIEDIFMNTIENIGQIEVTNPSNENIEIWIKASGEDNEDLSNIKYYVDGTGITGDFTDSYKKAVVLNKPKQGSGITKLNLNVYTIMHYDKPPIIYVTSIKI